VVETILAKVLNFNLMDIFVHVIVQQFLME
jgi:hypothetical protein